MISVRKSKKLEQQSLVKVEIDKNTEKNYNENGFLKSFSLLMMINSPNQAQRQCVTQKFCIFFAFFFLFVQIS